MADSLNLLVGLAMGLNLLALASQRLPSIIRFAAAQGMILGILPLMMEHELRLLVCLVAVATVGIKGFVIPALLTRALRKANIDREIAPLLGFIPSLLLGTVATTGAVVLGGALPLLPEHARLLLVPGALSTVVCGCLMLVGRSKAIGQVCGYLLLENGIYLFGMLLLEATPLLVEAGILLDLTVGVFIIGIIVDRIQREFDTLDTRKLSVLRE
ncbi:MAG: hydrogenase [Acidobacteria bacterium]|nr:hydrogenase [Acidobacteriota bacterium]